MNGQCGRSTVACVIPGDNWLSVEPRQVSTARVSGWSRVGVSITLIFYAAQHHRLTPAVLTCCPPLLHR